MPHIYVDADACPVIKNIEKIAKKYNLGCTLVCDTNHEFRSDYSEVKTISAGADAVDIALINMCRAGDIVVSQDYGVATLALGKKAYAIHQSGLWYTEDNIDQLMMERYISKKARMASAKHHLKGPAKRTQQDNMKFEESFEMLVQKVLTDNIE